MAAYGASDLREVAKDAVQIAVEKSSSQAEIAYELADVLVAEINPARLRQALVNIATNALEAMPQGGTLTVAGSNGAGVVRLSIADTGPGMTAEQVESAFLRFRTTKKARGGTGLGLPIAKRIVEDEHRGTLVMTSIVGSGTERKSRRDSDTERNVRADSASASRTAASGCCSSTPSRSRILATSTFGSPGAPSTLMSSASAFSSGNSVIRRRWCGRR